MQFPPSNRDPKEVKEQIGVLRELTRVTQVLHEAQVLQLQIWPRIVLDGVKDFEIQAVLEPGSRSLTFDVRSDASEQPLEVTRMRLDHLSSWVKWLLGDDVRMRCRLNGVLVYG